MKRGLEFYFLERFTISHTFSALLRNRRDLKISVKIADQPPVQVFIK